MSNTWMMREEGKGGKERERKEGAPAQCSILYRYLLESIKNRKNWGKKIFKNIKRIKSFVGYSRRV